MHQRIIAACVLAATYTTGAHAIVIGGGVTGGSAQADGGVFTQLTPPLLSSCSQGTPPGNVVGSNCFQSPNLYAFNEGQNLTIPSALTVNEVPSGGTTTIAAGTVVASHYVFFDPQQSRTQQGFVAFDADILGIMTQTSTLAASDFFIPTGITYLNPGLRGLEGGDNAIIDPSNARRVLVDWVADSPGDYIRVLTAESPGGQPPTNQVSEPAVLALMAFGVAGLGFRRRRRR